jgi:tetratricopeptide (TPR) repeat protein
VLARLLDAAEPAAEHLLERLVDAQLLESPAPRRYRLHDLLRLFARELAADGLTGAEQAAALTRALGFYLATTRNAFRMVRPGDQRLAGADDEWSHGGQDFADAGAALEWLEAERPNLVAAVGQAAAAGGAGDEIAPHLARALFGLFIVRGYWQVGITVNSHALTAARRAGNRVAEGQVHNDLGVIYQRSGDPDRALVCLNESLRIFRSLGDRRGQASSLTNLGILHDLQGRYDQALSGHTESLALFRSLADRYGQASSLTNLGLVHQRRKEYPEAARCHTESLAIRRELGDRYGEASSLANLGILYLEQGRYDQALACNQGGLDLFAELGLSFGQGTCLREIGSTLAAVGETENARSYWRKALAIFERLAAPQADTVRRLLADSPGV